LGADTLCLCSDVGLFAVKTYAVFVEDACDTPSICGWCCGIFVILLAPRRRIYAKPPERHHLENVLYKAYVHNSQNKVFVRPNIVEFLQQDACQPPTQLSFNKCTYSKILFDLFNVRTRTFSRIFKRNDTNPTTASIRKLKYSCKYLHETELELVRTMQKGVVLRYSEEQAPTYTERILQNT
jgi:hypothetical protein